MDRTITVQFATDARSEPYLQGHAPIMGHLGPYMARRTQKMAQHQIQRLLQQFDSIIIVRLPCG